MIPRREMKEKSVPFQADESKLERFPVTRQAFVTVSYKDTGKLGYNLFMEKMFKNLGRYLMTNREGFDRDLAARDMGANALNLVLGNYGFPNHAMLSWSSLVVPPFLSEDKAKKTPGQFTADVKQAAKLYGADLVGIAPIDERWLFSSDMEKPYVVKDIEKPKESEEAFEIPKSFRFAIVLAVSMDAEKIETSPDLPASVATSAGYSRMAIGAVSLAEYIRALGYQAIPAMNDTALSIPLAVEAGLGELGRMGILITPEFGPNVRLYKVLTDLPLLRDHPIDFGVEAFCNNCLLCAQSCPSGAISSGEQTYEGTTDNNNPGVKKWYIESEKCLRFWQVNGASCANCIAVCPFTKGFDSMQCFECTQCDTTNGCELQVNTYFRKKYGYLEDTPWGTASKVIPRPRVGL
ncbi:MAG TPA: reductive dehalogenase [Eubacteriaceae bacterium]|nr:reductive dehalogenase [Eubacteriaceae bacterium]